MIKQQIEANWLQFKGFIVENFGKLTDDDVHEIDGSYDRFVARLAKRYDVDTKVAEHMVSGVHYENGSFVFDTDVQGEGNYDAARKFQDAQHEFAEKMK